MSLMHLRLTLTIAGLLTSILCPGYASGQADRVGIGQAGGFRKPSSLLSVSSPFRFPNRSVWHPLIYVGSGVVWMVPPQVIVVPMLVPQVASEVPAPVPQPKFVSPPPESAPSTSRSHTIIMQHGSQIEVQSFPAVR
jgi:hypothetical protein